MFVLPQSLVQGVNSTIIRQIRILYSRYALIGISYTVCAEDSVRALQFVGMCFDVTFERNSV